MVSARKLTFVINSLHGGGAERVLSNIANFFCDRGYNVTIACLNSANPAYALRPGVKVVSLVSGKREGKLLYRIWYCAATFFRMNRLLKKEKPDFVISFMTSANFWAGITCTIRGIPYVVSERITPDYTVNQFNVYMQWLFSIVYENSKAIVVPSRGMIGGFAKKPTFRRLRNFEVINNPVNQFKYAAGRKVYHRKFILGVGRLDRQKGFDLLIAAFKRLDLYDTDLLISGEGQERNHLEGMIRDQQLEDRVKLIGYQQNLQDYYHQAELFVLSSRNEGYPNVLVEAMSFGCACIATDCEFGPSDIIENEENGLLIKANDIKSLYAAMHRVLSDPILKARISRNASKINDANSQENTCAKWEQLVLSYI